MISLSVLGKGRYMLEFWLKEHVEGLITEEHVHLEMIEDVSIKFLLNQISKKNNCIKVLWTGQINREALF